MTYSEKSVGPFLVGTSGEVPFSKKGATPGPVIDSPIFGYDVTVGVQVANPPSKGKVKLLLEVSLDRINFSAPQEVGEIDLKVEEMQVSTVNLKSLRAPFYRLSIAGKDDETEVIEPAPEPEESEDEDSSKKSKAKKSEPGTVTFYYAAPTGEARR